MKRRTYKALELIPIVGVFVKICCDGTYRLCGSLVMEAAANGEDDGWLEYMHDYFRKHPDVHPTNELIDRLSEEWRNSKK